MAGSAPANYGVQALVNFAEVAAHLSPDELVRQAQEAISRFQTYYQAPGEGNGWKCPTCGHASKYQGWANWETWNFALWMDNSEGDQAFMYEAVEEAGSVREAAEFLKSHFNDSELCPLLSQSGIYSDLLQGGLDAVEWEEVARHFKPDEWGNADEMPDDDDDDDDDTGYHHDTQMSDMGDD